LIFTVGSSHMQLVGNTVKNQAQIDGLEVNKLFGLSNSRNRHVSN